MEEIRNQKEFDKYIRQLPDKDNCQFMIGIVVDLCNKEEFECPYRGKETYSLNIGKKKECKRKKIVALRRSLGVKR
ncbi:hypothetical protein HQ529_06290 [Candidatus Woesearchaeota archaeon]|nr:hypothetical protein [Candidatus Woesearchaeota archaeon]